MTYIPLDNLAYPLLLQFENGGSGSGFFLVQGETQYLVTAKHVLADEKGLLRSSNLTLTCPAKDVKESPAKLKLDLAVVPYSLHPQADVAVVRMGTRVPVIDSTMFNMNYVPGVTVLCYSPSGTVSVSAEQAVLRIASVTTGNDVLLYGYPTSLGLRQTPQFDFQRPLLRKGIVAGVHFEQGTIVLDCPAYPGNSGGPVVEVQEAGLTRLHRVVGVVSQFIPQVHQRYSPFTGKPSEPEYTNSGYSVAVSMDKVLDLVHDEPKISDQKAIERASILAKGAKVAHNG